MRTLLAASLLFSLTACSSASDGKDDKKDPPKEAKKVLKIGDPAPAFKATKWLNGSETPTFAKDKVYVLDFWAIWCGPCIQAMPHLAALQAEYKDQGLVVLPVTTIDRRNPLVRVEEFAKKRGPKLGLTFAVSETNYLEEAYMEAAERDSLPSTFVVDKAGKIAFIGHPMELDDVLPKVLAGTWRGQPDIDEIKAQDEALGAIFQKAGKDAAAAVKELPGFEAKYPAKAKQPMFQVTKLALMVQGKLYDDAKKLTEELMPKLVEKKASGLLQNVRAIWADDELNPKRTHVQLAVKAAEAILKIDGDADPIALVGAADAYFAAGDKAKAVELAEKALKAAGDDAQLKRFLNEQLEKFKK